MRNIRRLLVLPEITLFGHKVTTFIWFYQNFFVSTVIFYYLCRNFKQKYGRKRNFSSRYHASACGSTY